MLSPKAVLKRERNSSSNQHLSVDATGQLLRRQSCRWVRSRGTGCLSACRQGAPVLRVEGYHVLSSLVYVCPFPDDRHTGFQTKTKDSFI